MNDGLPGLDRRSYLDAEEFWLEINLNRRFCSAVHASLGTASEYRDLSRPHAMAFERQVST